jgi:MFS family permease
MPPENKPEARILGLNKNVFILGIVSFFNDFSNEMILSSFPAFFTSVLKSGAASLGLVEGVADGASNLLKIYSGQLSDKIQKRRIFLFLGYGLSVLIRPFYALTSSVAAVLGLRVIDRVGKGMREAPRDVIISGSVKQTEMGRSFGYHRALDAAGGILGPLAAYFILLKWPGNFNAIFITAFLLGLIAVASIIFVTDIVISKNSNGVRHFSWSGFKLMPSAFKKYLLAIFLLSIGSLPVAVLLLKTTSIGLVVASIPLFYMVYSLSFAAFSYFAGELADKIGEIKVLLCGYVILILSYALIGYAEATYVLIAAFIVLGLFSAATDAIQRSFAGHLAPLEERGTAYGLFNGAVGFGTMIAGICGGYLWQVFSPATALVVSVVMVGVGLVVLLSSRKAVN